MSRLEFLKDFKMYAELDGWKQRGQSGGRWRERTWAIRDGFHAGQYECCLRWRDGDVDCLLRYVATYPEEAVWGCLQKFTYWEQERRHTERKGKA